MAKKRKVKDCQELAQAVNDGIEFIVITDNGLTKHVQKIKAVGKTAWVLAAGAVIAALATATGTVLTGGASSPMTGPAEFAFMGTASSILGVPAAMTAASIAFAGGGVAVLNSLRKYSLEMKDSGTAILRK